MNYTQKTLKLYELNITESDLVRECIAKLNDIKAILTTKLHIECLEVCVTEVEMNPRFNKNPVRLIDTVCLKTNVGCIDIKFTKHSDTRISDVAIGGEVMLSRKDEIPVIDLRFSTSAICKFGYGMNVLVYLQWSKNLE